MTSRCLRLYGRRFRPHAASLGWGGGRGKRGHGAETKAGGGGGYRRMKERYGRGWRQGWSREKGGCRTHAGGMQEGCRQGYGQRCREGCRGDAGGFPGILSPISAPPPCSAPLGTLHPPHDSPAPPCWPSMGTRPPQRVARAVGGVPGVPDWDGAVPRPGRGHMAAFEPEPQLEGGPWPCGTARHSRQRWQAVPTPK